MADDADLYVAHYLEKKNRETDSVLLETVLKLQQVSTEDKDRLEAQQKLQKYTNKDQGEILKEGCMTLWTEYPEPSRTVRDAIGVNERYKNEKLETIKQEKDIQAVAASVSKQESFSKESTTVMPDFKDAYHQLGDTFYAVDPKTGFIDETPLVNPLTFTLEDFMDKVSISPHSKAVHTIETIKNFLTYGAELGLSRKALGDILKEFVRKFLPQHSAVVHFLHDSTEIFKAVLSTVNLNVLQEQITKAIQKITREPGQSIETCLGAYKALLVESATWENPTLTEEQVMRKTEKQCIAAARFLIEPNLAKQLENVKKKFSVQLDRKITFHEVIEFIIKNERKPEYKLKSTKTLQNNPVTCSIFNSEIEFTNNQYHSNDHVEDTLEVNMQDSSTYKGFENTSQIQRRDKRLNKSGPAGIANNFKRFYQDKIRNSVNYGRQQNAASNTQNKEQAHHSQRGASNTNFEQRDNRNITQDKTQTQSNPSTPERRGSFSETSNQFKPSAPPSPSSSPDSMRGRSQSPWYFKDKRGRMRRRESLHSKYETKKHPWYRRSNSGNYYQRSQSRPRDLSRGRPRDRNSRTDRGNSRYNQNRYPCKACGSKTHSRPTSLARIPNTPADKLCPYANHPIQTQPCTKCNKNLFHPEASCLSARPSSRLNSRERTRGFNTNLN